MFELEGAIADWRRQMHDAGIKSFTVLNELENHLRDDVTAQVRTGAGAARAFESAVERIGEMRMLKQEFKKVAGKKERNQVKQIVMILTGLLGMFMGFGLMWPQMGMLAQRGTMPSVNAFLAGGAVAAAAAGVIFYHIRGQRVARGRKWVGLAVIVAGIFISAINISGLVSDAGKSGSMALFGWSMVTAVVALFFGVTYHLNRTHPAQSVREN